MAKAEKTVILETQVVQTDGIRLDLTMEEARVLRLVVGGIGNGTNNRGRAIEAIYCALVSAKVESLGDYAPFSMNGRWPVIKDGPV